MVALLTGMVVGLIGCGEEAVQPPTAPSEPAATQPAAPTPPVSVSAGTIEVSGEPYLLPPMTLRTEPGVGGITVTLAGVEAEQHETGNTLFLDMAVDAADVAGLGQTSWRFTSPDEEWTDTPRGITLSDERFILRPADVTVNFAPGAGVVGITLQGRFLLWDMNADAAAKPQRVTVHGQFDASVVP